MPQHKPPTHESAFLRGVDRGRKEAAHGDFHDAAIGLAIIFGAMLLSAWAFVRILRWLVRSF